jgi:hypothetical protein
LSDQSALPPKTNDEFKIRCLLYRQISRFDTSQDLVDINSRAPEQVIEIRPIGHETALIDKIFVWVNSGNPIFDGKPHDPLSLGRELAIGLRHNGIDLLLFCDLKALPKPLGSA